MKALLVGGALHGTVTSVIGTPRELIIPSDYIPDGESNQERYRYVFVGETLPTRNGELHVDAQDLVTGCAR